MIKSEENLELYTTGLKQAYPISEINGVFHSNRVSAERYGDLSNRTNVVFKCSLLEPKRKIFDLNNSLHINVLKSILPGSIILNSNVVIMSSTIKEQLESNEFEKSMLNERGIIRALKKYNFVGHVLHFPDHSMYVIYEPLKTVKIIENL